MWHVVTLVFLSHVCHLMQEIVDTFETIVFQSVLIYDQKECGYGII